MILDILITSRAPSLLRGTRRCPDIVLSSPGAAGRDVDDEVHVAERFAEVAAGAGELCQGLLLPGCGVGVSGNEVGGEGGVREEPDCYARGLPVVDVDAAALGVERGAGGGEGGAGFVGAASGESVLVVRGDGAAGRSVAGVAVRFE